MHSVERDDSLLDIDGAAAILNCSVRTVERLQAEGRLEPVYLSTPRGAKRRRFRPADVEALNAQAAS